VTRERDGAATVIAQDGDRVQVEHRGEKLTVPMKGFPAGFSLTPGSRVILTDEPSGPVARTLVRAFTSRVDAQAVARRGTFEAAGRRLQMQPSTVVESLERPEQTDAAAEYEVWITEGGADQTPSQVVAVRRRP